MTAERAQQIFANELRKRGYEDYAKLVENGQDVSEGGRVTINAILQACKEAALDLCKR